MENNAIKGNLERLEDTIDQLTDEYQFNFLCVLEALSFAQNEREETEQITGNR